MSLADLEFIEMCKDILNNGSSTEGQNVRAHWPDGTPAYTIMKFGIVNRFDLTKEFPALTLRKTGIKSATDEILWIFQKKSNNIKDLKPHIWDEWADSDGSIGKAYGYQLSLKHKYSEVTESGLQNAFGDSLTVKFENINGNLIRPEDFEYDIREYRAIKDIDSGKFYLDQVDKVIYDLKNNPFSRRIMTTIWNPEDLDDMNLQPCAWNCEFVVTKNDDDSLTLNMILNQRSQDVLAAWAWNTMQYAVLQHMIAQVCDMTPGEFIHTDANAHIYAPRHIDSIKELISRTPQPAPKFWLNPEIKDFYKFTTDDVKLIDYEVAGPQITNIEIAI